MTEKEIREKIRLLQEQNKNSLAFWNDTNLIWENNHKIDELTQKLEEVI